MTGPSLLRTAELPATLADAIGRYLSFLAAMRATGCVLPRGRAPRFEDARNPGDIVAAHLRSDDPSPLAAVIASDLRRLHRDPIVRRRFVPRRWRRLGRLAMTALNVGRRAAGGGRRATLVLPRLGSLLPPIPPRAEDEAFVSGFAAFLDRQPPDPDLPAIAAYARLACPASDAAERTDRLARELADSTPRRLALLADSLNAGHDFGPLRTPLARAAANALALASQHALAAALGGKVDRAGADLVERQASAAWRGHRVDMLTPLFAGQGAEILWDGAITPSSIVDLSAPQASRPTMVSVILDARRAGGDLIGATGASILAQAHDRIELLVMTGPAGDAIGGGDERVRLLADVSADPPAAIWNRAWTCARGDLLAIAVPGEFWLRNALAALVTAVYEPGVKAARASAILAGGGGGLALVATGIVCLDRATVTATGAFDAAAEAPLEEMVGRIVASYGAAALRQLDAILSIGEGARPDRAFREGRASWSSRHLRAMRAGEKPDRPEPTQSPAPQPAVRTAEAARAPADPLAQILGFERARDWAAIAAATEAEPSGIGDAAGFRIALARADALRLLGRGGAALATLAAAEARHGASHQTRERAATLHALFGDQDAALAALAEAIAALPVSSGRAAFRALATRRAETLIRLDRIDEARDAMEALIGAGAPNHLEFATLARTARTPDEIDRLERTFAPFAARADARARSALHNFAVACRDRGLPDGAIAATRKRFLHALEHAAYGSRPVAGREDWSSDAAVALADFVADLAPIGLRPFLVSGTLLGHVREGNVLGHDKDIDLGVFTDISPDAIREALRRNGRFLLRPAANERFIQASHANGTVIDLFLHWTEGDDVYHQGIKTRWRNRAFAIEPATFLGSPVLVPVPVERYLIENYGPGWRTPEPDFETFVDTPNMEIDDEGHLTWYLLTRLHDYYLAAKPLQFRRVWSALAPRLGCDPAFEAAVARALATIDAA